MPEPRPTSSDTGGLRAAFSCADPAVRRARLLLLRRRKDAHKYRALQDSEPQIGTMIPIIRLLATEKSVPPKAHQALTGAATR